MRSGMGPALYDRLGGELSTGHAARVVEGCVIDSGARTASAGASGVALFAVSSAPIASGGCAALQTARCFE